MRRVSSLRCGPCRISSSLVPFVTASRRERLEYLLVGTRECRRVPDSNARQMRQAFRSRTASTTQTPHIAAKKTARPPVMIALSQISVTESITASLGSFER